MYWLLFCTLMFLGICQNSSTPKSAVASSVPRWLQRQMAGPWLPCALRSAPGQRGQTFPKDSLSGPAQVPPHPGDTCPGDKHPCLRLKEAHRSPPPLQPPTLASGEGIIFHISFLGMELQEKAMGTHRLRSLPPQHTLSTWGPACACSMAIMFTAKVQQAGERADALAPEAR